MELSGKFTIEAAKEKVWDVFMDAEKLAGCVPGVEQIKVISPTQYEADMVVKVQFMTIKFQATGELKEASNKDTLKVELVGKPVALAGLFRNRLVVKLRDIVPETTEVYYDMDLQLTGRLASLGMILIKGTIQKSAREFSDNVKELFSVKGDHIGRT